MAEAPVEKTSGSQEAIALSLLRLVAVAEGKPLHNVGGANREWILKAYAECLETVRAPSIKWRPS